VSRNEKGSVSRRQLLGAAAATAATAGCSRRVRSILGRHNDNQMSLSIAAVPADIDEASVRIARRLRSHLDAVGVATSIDYFSLQEFWLEFLVNQSFDIAVGPHPDGSDPDHLYGMFHSAFSPEGGWQNPYGVTDLELDDLLEQQRTETGTDRASTVADVLRWTRREQPVTPLCVPVDHRLIRPDRVSGVAGRRFDRGSDLLGLTFDSDDDSELRVVLGHGLPTVNLNPLSVEYRQSDAVTGLLYDPLVVVSNGEHRPWLAETVEWGDRTVTVSLREAVWHDGEPVTAGDVAFTYRLLADTSLGGFESPAPAARFRARASLVESAETRDDRTVTLSVGGSRPVARRALTVPVLPEHVWRDRTGRADIGGILRSEQTTEAVVDDNVPPVGSGPYEFADRAENEELVLERDPEHFSLTADDIESLRPPAAQLRLTVAPSDAAAREWVETGEADVTLSPVWHEAADPGEQQVRTTQGSRFYQVAYNTRRAPLSNSLFRRLVSRLVDRAWVAAELFDGAARPLTTPLTAEGWVPDALAWSGEDPVLPFLGSDGRIDAERARERLAEIGYQYDGDGSLIAVGEG
jgi:peptide/nickel transport system substrate-binding protein